MQHKTFDDRLGELLFRFFIEYKLAVGSYIDELKNFSTMDLIDHLWENSSRIYGKTFRGRKIISERLWAYLMDALDDDKMKPFAFSESAPHGLYLNHWECALLDYLNKGFPVNNETDFP